METKSPPQQLACDNPKRALVIWKNNLVDEFQANVPKGDESHYNDWIDINN